MKRRKRVSLKWFINCGCGFRTDSLREAVEHVKKTRHHMGGKITVSPG